MFWLYLLVPLIILCVAGGVINWRRRRGISYDRESTAQLARARAESTWREGRLSRHCLLGGGQVVEQSTRLSGLGKRRKSDRQPHRSADSRVGIRARSKQSVISPASLPAVHVSPKSLRVVRRGGVHRGSHPYTMPGLLIA